MYDGGLFGQAGLYAGCVREFGKARVDTHGVSCTGWRFGGILWGGGVHDEGHALYWEIDTLETQIQSSTR